MGQSCCLPVSEIAGTRETPRKGSPKDESMEQALCPQATGIAKHDEYADACLVNINAETNEEKVPLLAETNAAPVAETDISVPSCSESPIAHGIVTDLGGKDDQEPEEEATPAHISPRPASPSSQAEPADMPVVRVDSPRSSPCSSPAATPARQSVPSGNMECPASPQSTISPRAQRSKKEPEEEVVYAEVKVDVKENLLMASSEIVSTTSASFESPPDEKVANLMARYPDRTRKEVEDALAKADGHAGLVARNFNKSKKKPTKDFE